MGKEKTTTVIDGSSRAEATPEETKLNQLLLDRQEATAPQAIESDILGFNLLNKLLSGSTLPGGLAPLQQGITQQGVSTAPTQIGLQQATSANQIPLSSGMISGEQASALAQEGIKDLPSFFQSSGILDSGVAADITAGTASDIRRDVAERNLERRLAIQQENISRSTEQEQFNIANQLATDQANIGTGLGQEQFNIGQKNIQDQFNLGQLLNLLNLAIGAPAQIQAPVAQSGQQLSQALAGLRTNFTQGSSTVSGMNPFMKSFQTSLGEGLGAGLTSGIGTPFAGGAGGAAGTAGGTAGTAGAIAGIAGGCWVAKEVFGSWEHPKTHAARYYIHNIGPKWFSRLYMKHGEQFANFISNKPVIKALIRPLFEFFAREGAVVGGVNYGN